MSEQIKLSPKITFFKWGKLEIDGYQSAFRDAIFYPGGVNKWDWKETNLHHDPGIQPIDVQILLDKACDVVVLSRGVELRLLTMPETLSLLAEHNIETYVLQTEEAIAKFNELAEQGRQVGALIHSTC
jgi:hypothetical protein